MIALVTLTVATGSAYQVSGAPSAHPELDNPSPGAGAAASRVRARECTSARMGLAFYRVRHSRWMSLRGIETRPKIDQPKGCAYTLWLAHRWKARSYQARLAYQRWYKEQLRFQLRDGSWQRAVREVQRVFPGTESWLLSCSDAESNHHRWVGYGGVPYSTWLRDSNTVGGYMQFRFGTFSYMYRAAYGYLRERGFRVPPDLRDWRSTEGLTRGWRSALGQALAGGWARYTGNDNSHWSASWGNGC